MHWTEKTKRLVEESGLSYRKVEQRAGWTLNTLRAAIRDRTNPRIDKAVGLARALQVQADWLFDEAKTWESRPPSHAPPAYFVALLERFADEFHSYGALRYEFRERVGQLICMLFEFQSYCEGEDVHHRSGMENKVAGIEHFLDMTIHFIYDSMPFEPATPEQRRKVTVSGQSPEERRQTLQDAARDAWRSLGKPRARGPESPGQSSNARGKKPGASTAKKSPRRATKPQ